MKKKKKNLWRDARVALKANNFKFGIICHKGVIEGQVYEQGMSRETSGDSRKDCV
jgi:hypothetical protein